MLGAMLFKNIFVVATYLWVFTFDVMVRERSVVRKRWAGDNAETMTTKFLA